MGLLHPYLVEDDDKQGKIILILLVAARETMHIGKHGKLTFCSRLFGFWHSPDESIVVAGFATRGGCCLSGNDDFNLFGNEFFADVFAFFLFSFRWSGNPRRASLALFLRICLAMSCSYIDQSSLATFGLYGHERHFVCQSLWSNN